MLLIEAGQHVRHRSPFGRVLPKLRHGLDDSWPVRGQGRLIAIDIRWYVGRETDTGGAAAAETSPSRACYLKAAAAPTWLEHLPCGLEVRWSPPGRGDVSKLPERGW